MGGWVAGWLSGWVGGSVDRRVGLCVGRLVGEWAARTVTAVAVATLQPHMQGGGAATAWRASGAGQPQRELTTTAPGSRSPGWRCCSQPAGWRVAEIGWGEVARRVQRRTGATSSPRCETWKYSQTIGLPACIWARAGSRAPCSPAPSCAGSPLLRQAVSEQVRLTL